MNQAGYAQVVLPKQQTITQLQTMELPITIGSYRL